MKSKKTIALVLASMILISGCSAKTDIQSEPAVTSSSETTIEPIKFDETSETTAEKAKFEFNPHVYSAQLGKSVSKEKWDALYNLCDALRAGETTFKCESEEAYKWAMDDTVLCCLFPAAGLKVDTKMEDGSPAFENGTGKIHYKMDIQEYLKRQADFEVLILDMINSSVEKDDTDYEKALKLYLYVAENFTYEHEVEEVDNYVYKTFTRKKGQCINYAAVYAYLLLQVGVDALPAGTFDGLCHAWTYVVINGKGYHIDTTWALRSEYPGIESVYLDYFMMSDAERDADNCLVKGLTVDILPGYWVSNQDVSYKAEDNHYNLRSLCRFVKLDEENKILHYIDMEDKPHEFHYDI